MSNIQFPVHFQFNIATFSNDFTASDANGNSFAYVRQKMFKFIEDIEIFENESRSNLIYKIKADRWLDFSAAYSFYNSSGQEIGKIVRKGWRSMWRASYEIIDENKQILYHINEESVFTRILDNMLSEIPILNLLTGYLFHPSYLITDENGEVVAKLKKLSSFFGRKFDIEATEKLKDAHKEKVVLGMMMMILLERRRG
ncbi:MAG: hypothetical protein ACI9XJ_002773 [Marivirga sp.]|jgi:uncharacterized protein YxjI